MRTRVNKKKNSLRLKINSNKSKFFKLVHSQLIKKRQELGWIKTDEQ